MSVVEEMKRLTERYAELESAKEAIEDLIISMQEIHLPSGIEGSHHADMEWSNTVEQIENEMQEIEDRIR